jgi:two-component system, OmpR family, sensor kinase
VWFDLADLVQDLVDEARERGPDSFTWRIQLEPSAVQGDPMMLQLAVGNVLDNVRRHAHGATSIEVEVTAGPRTRCRVTDDGAGIDPDVVGSLAEPFARCRSSEGLGLGLSLVRAIVEAHKGCLQVEGTEGRGTRVTIDLPGMAM